MGRIENTVVFENTEKLCRTDPVIAEFVKQSTADQKIFLERNALPAVVRNKYEEIAKVVVSGKRSFEAAQGYRGNRAAVLNFANAKYPGGGVTKGASAQEESLCRCSGLYFSLNTKSMLDGFYYPHRKMRTPLYNDDLIYTPTVIVFKSDTASPRLMPEADWYTVDVITCAAPNLRDMPGYGANRSSVSGGTWIRRDELRELHEKRLRRILDVAILMGDDTVILGAFGCGAFCNEPEVVAEAARNVLPDYMYAFKNIEYAIYCSPWDERNYTVFKNVLGGFCQ